MIWKQDVPNTAVDTKLPESGRKDRALKESYSLQIALPPSTFSCVKTTTKTNETSIDIHLDSPLKGLEKYEGAPVDEIHTLRRDLGFGRAGRRNKPWSKNGGEL